ncbi:lipopolysaccharide biosynthesis protein [Streptomyces paludis]|uniref:Lipopolysaccharide biosynthesis protein n=1 Tax=Streptomyces paludis TaxID=2282738 RepID=A0A345HNE4_9ACTN|nr:lipopolysaccharide biosynthesis protein [Streptomyces paludis]
MADTARLPGRADRPAPPPASPAPPAKPPGGDSMFRNAYALMLSTGVSAALGLGFWLVAARYYTEEAVGQGSAAIAAMRLLASITATTMIGAVVRYVPRAGRATGPLVWRAYAVSSLVVCVACVVFLMTLDLWGPSYAPLGGLTAGLVFTASCVAWALLTLQDGVLTGLRRAFWVPVGNAVFSLGKLVLLVVLATALPVLGVFVSWAAAIALSVLPLGWLIFRRLIPRQAAADRDREPPRAADIGRFLAGDSVGALFSLAMINLLPVLVAVRFDAAHNAFFYTAYTVGGTMEFMAINMASSLTAHASHSPDRLAEGVRGALRRMALLLVPVVLVLVVFAPQVLAPFGADYARHGTTVLRLLAAAALPRVIVELYIGVLRVQGRTGLLAALQGAMCVLVLGSALYLFGPGGAGIAGAGVAMLLPMTLMALVAALGLRLALRPGARGAYGARHRRSGGYRAGAGAGAGTGAGATVVSDGYGTNWAREAAAPAPARSSGSGRIDESRLITLLWLLLGTSVGLFWAPLVRVGDLGLDRLTGARLLDVLPPLTLLGAIVLIVVQCATVSLVRPGAALLVLGPLLTFAALHSAPLLIGVRPDPLSGRWHGPVADAVTRLADWAAGMRADLGAGQAATGAAGAADRDAVLCALPVALQLLCLLLVALALWAVRTDGRLAASVLWVLVVAGWAAQGLFASAAVPVALALLAVASAALAVRARFPRQRVGNG